jgi:hypothetical protein
MAQLTWARTSSNNEIRIFQQKSLQVIGFEGFFAGTTPQIFNLLFESLHMNILRPKQTF